MKDSLMPVARKENLVIQELQDEVLVFDTKTNKAHCLNQTASAIWKYCDGTNSIADIVKNFETQTGSTVPENLVWLAIDQLNEKDLFENSFEGKFAGENRRQVLKKIGMATVIALPIVASITAPTAALAVVCSGTVISCSAGMCNPQTPCYIGGDPKGPVGMCTAAGTCE